MPATPIPDSHDICTAIDRMVLTDADVVSILRAVSCRYGRFQHDPVICEQVQRPLDELADEIEEDLCRPPTAEEAVEWARERRDEARFEDARLGELA